MSVSTSSTGVAAGPNQRVRRLTLWSQLMVPTFVVVYFATSFIGLYLVLDLLGLGEGDLFLMQRGVAGWVTEILFTLVLAAAPVAGIRLAVAALRDRATPGDVAERGQRVRWGAWAALVINGILVLVVIYMFVDAILMTYYPTLR